MAELFTVCLGGFILILFGGFVLAVAAKIISTVAFLIGFDITGHIDPNRVEENRWEGSPKMTALEQERADIERFRRSYARMTRAEREEIARMYHTRDASPENLAKKSYEHWLEVQAEAMDIGNLQDQGHDPYADGAYGYDWSRIDWDKFLD